MPWGAPPEAAWDPSEAPPVTNVLHSKYKILQINYVSNLYKKLGQKKVEILK